MKKSLISALILFHTALLHAQPDIAGFSPDLKLLPAESAAPATKTAIADTSMKKMKTPGIKGLYLETGMNAGSAGFSLGILGLRYQFSEKWTAAVSCLYFSMKPNNLPSNYRAEQGTAFFISTNGRPVRVHMNDLHLTAGRFFRMSPGAWFSCEGGLSVLMGEKATFTGKETIVTDPLWLLLGIQSTSSNYKVQINKATVAGAVTRADLNFKISSSMMIRTGIYKNFNSLRTPASFQLSFLIGPAGHKK